jgi:hypothetical protein
MFNRFLLSLVFIFLSQLSIAQNKTILPFTGIRYVAEGISAKSVDVKIDGATLLNNRIPLNKEFEIKLQSATGFTEDKSKMIFAAAEVNIVSPSGAVLGNIPNIFKENEAKGFPAATIKDLSIKLLLKSEMIGTQPACVIKIRYYDLKSKNMLRLEFPIAIARAGEVLQLSKSVSDAKIQAPFVAKSSAVKIKNVEVTVDTSIRVAPKMAYTSLDMSGIEGTSIAEVLSGKESFWVFDADLNEIKISDKQLKQVGGAMENNVVNYLSKIPFRLKASPGKTYFIRFRWESADKRKVIDVVVSK